MKELSPEQIKNLMAKDNKSKRLDEYMENVKRWPGDNNLRLLAVAVERSRTSVIFEDGTLFKIRYDSKYKAVFIKPADGTFTPCGYISLARLKGLANGGT